MRIRFGNLELSVMMYLIGLIFFMIMIMLGMPLIFWFLMFIGIMFTFSGLLWICWLCAKYRLRPQIDKCKADETIWLRTTKDRIFIPQFVLKGPYGQTKGVISRVPADVVDDGDFPIKLLNGNPAIIMYDMMNTAVDLKKSVGRKLMSKKYGIRNGIEGYQKAKEKGEVMFPNERGKEERKQST